MALTTIDDRGLKTPIDLLDNEKIRFGTGNDLQILHDSANSYINNLTGELCIGSDTIRLRSYDGTHDYVKGFVNGSTELYYDNSKKFETTSAGTTTTGNHVVAGLVACDGLLADDNEKIKLGSGEDLEIYFDGTHSKVDHTPGSGNLFLSGDSLLLTNSGQSEYYLSATENGAVELYYDNAKKLETTAYGAKISSNGSAGYLEVSTTGNLGEGHIEIIGGEGGKASLSLTADEGDDNADRWRVSGAADGTFTINNKASGSWETNFKTTGNGAVELYYDNVKKFETSSNGITVTAGSTDSAIAIFTGNDSNRGLKVSTATENSQTDMLVELEAHGQHSSAYEGEISLKTGGAHRLRVDKAGNVGIGTTSPDCNFHVYKGDSGGSTAANSTVSIEHSDTATLQFLSPNNKYNAIRFGDNNDNGAGWLQYNHSDNSMQFGTNGSEKIRVHSGGETNFTAGIVLGNGSTYAASNTLDDYEEGTWTPDFFYHSSVSNVYGHYTKIGRMVYAYFTGVIYSNQSNQQYISNLPFTAINITGGAGGVARGYQNFDIQDGPIYYIEENTNDMYFYKDNGQNMPASDLNGKAVRGMAVYTAAS